MVDAQHGPVQRAPDNEGPARSVPGPADKHGQEEVAVLLEFAVAVAAQGNVEKIAQPCAQRNVPAPPEVHDARGFVGGVEVFRQAQAQHKAQTQGHIRIAGKVKIELKGIAERAQPGFGPA